MEVSIKECKFTYGNITRKLYEEDRQRYDGAIIGIYLNNLKDGFIVSKVGKPSTKGTKVTCKAIRDNNEIDSYVKKVNEMIDEYNTKYNYKVKHIEMRGN